MPEPIVVVIPAYNEEDNIAHVLRAIPKRVCGLPLQVFVIDDGSTDRTVEVALAEGAAVSSSPVNLGGGAATRQGFAIARGVLAEVVVTMDADGQHDPAEMERLVKPILMGDLDVVIGSRILGEREPDSAVRYAGLRFFGGVIRLLTSQRITDCSSGFRAFRVEILPRLTLQQDQFHTAELIIEASKRGVAIGEVPVTVRRRCNGTSKKGGDLSYGLSFARAVAETYWRTDARPDNGC